MINKITDEILQKTKTNLSSIELREVFDEIFQGLATDVSASAFLTALKSLELDCGSICAIVESSKDAISKITLPVESSFETVYFDFDYKYLDVFCAVDLINSANGLNSVKFDFPLYAKKLSAFKALKIDVDKIFLNPLECLEKYGFSCFLISNDEKYLKYTLNIKNNLSFKTVLDICEGFLNPYNVKNQFIGVKNSEDVQKYAEISLGLKNENTIIVSSLLPYAVLEGENVVAEAWKNKIFTYNMNSKLLDLPEYPLDDIRIENMEENAEIIENVFKNKIKNAPYYTIILNSALSLYISKKANSLLDAINLSKKTIDDGLAFEKLEQLRKID